MVKLGVIPRKATTVASIRMVQKLLTKITVKKIAHKIGVKKQDLNFN